MILVLQPKKKIPVNLSALFPAYMRCEWALLYFVKSCHERPFCFRKKDTSTSGRKTRTTQKEGHNMNIRGTVLIFGRGGQALACPGISISGHYDK
jgi:hypothetical protein